MAVSLFPTLQFLDGEGAPLASGKVYSYEAGTSDAKDTYPTKDDADNQTNASANPVILDSAGRPPSQGIWLRDLHKLVVKTSADVTVKTYDEVGDSGDTNTLPKDYLAGLVLSLDTDTDHDVNVTAGEARDDADSEDIVLAAEITKRVDASWAVGDDQGGLDTGSVANSTAYYVWLIKRVDTGVVDVLFSTSSTAPTMPTNYTKKRLIGYGITNGSANWTHRPIPANQPLSLGTGGRAAISGSWTPTIVSSGGGSATYTEQLGSYSLFGRVCFFRAIININSAAGLSSGNLSVAGLPFSAASGNANPLVNIAFDTGVTFIANAGAIVGLVSGSSVNLYFQMSNGGALTLITTSELASSSSVYVAGFYEIA